MADVQPDTGDIAVPKGRGPFANIESQIMGDLATTQKSVRARETQAGAIGKEIDQIISTGQSKIAGEQAKYEQNIQELQSSKPPEFQQTPPLQAFGSVAGALASIAGLLTRRPLVASLRAATGVMNAYKQQDYETYQRHYSEWKTNFDHGMQLANLQSNLIRQVMDDERLSVDEKLARMNALYAANRDEVALTVSKGQGLLGIANLENDRIRLAQNAALLGGKLEAQHIDSLLRFPLNQAAQDYQKALKTGNAAKINETRSALLEAQRQYSELAQKPESDPKKAAFAAWVRENPTATAEQTIEAAKRINTMSASVDLDDETLGDMARQYVAGDKSVLQGLGYGNAGAANRAKLRQKISQVMRSQNKTPEQIALAMAEFEGLKAGERSLAVRSAQLGMTIAEMEQFAPLALSASEGVNRGDYPTINAMIESTLKGTGDEGVVRFIDANTALITAYSQVMTRGGIPTDSAREMAKEVLSIAYSKGQYAAGVDQLMKEARAAELAPSLVQQQFRARAQNMGMNIPLPNAPLGTSSASLPRPRSAEERDQLPSGAHYIAPDGSERVR